MGVSPADSPPPRPSAPVRLTLVSHGMTDALRQARFPLDEPITDSARDALSASTLSPSALTRPDLAFRGPERRARQTALALGIDCSTAPELADLDHGSWAGHSMGQIADTDLLDWLVDPAAAPHGGESVAALLGRVRGWLAGLAGLADTVASTPGSGAGPGVLAVTHPSVIRAAVTCALDAPAAAFWRIDIAPATRTVLHGRGQRWTLRTTSAPLGT